MGLFGRRKREVKKSPTSSRPDYMSIEPSTISDPAERKKLIQKQLRYLNALVMHKNTYHPRGKRYRRWSIFCTFVARIFSLSCCIPSRSL